MSELISGKEALSRVHEGVVQYKCANDPVKDRWTTITDHYWSQYNLGVFLDLDTDWEFRIKPHTITLNGIEVPAPFEPKNGEYYYHIELGNFCGYKKREMIAKTCIYSQVGVWRTEEEIKKVVEALRSVFK